MCFGPRFYTPIKQQQQCIQFLIKDCVRFTSCKHSLFNNGFKILLHKWICILKYCDCSSQLTLKYIIPVPVFVRALETSIFVLLPCGDLSLAANTGAFFFYLLKCMVEIYCIQYWMQHFHWFYLKMSKGVHRIYRMQSLKNIHLLYFIRKFDFSINFVRHCWDQRSYQTLIFILLVLSQLQLLDVHNMNYWQTDMLFIPSSHQFIDKMKNKK
jgi:hypothetical protein